MNFWKRYQRIGNLLALAVLVLTLLLAFGSPPSELLPAPPRTGPAPIPGPGEPTGTTGL